MPTFYSGFLNLKLFCICCRPVACSKFSFGNIFLCISFGVNTSTIFRRPAVSSELFVMNEDGQALDGSSILLGSPLSLSLRFQLKNIPACLSGPPNKVYCILSCKPNSLVTNEIGDSKWQAQLRKHEEEIDDIMELNEKLLRYATGSVETQGLDCRRQDNDRLMVTEYVCFDLNEGGQGFSTCYLDVSVLAVGAYRIKWHSCYIDSGGCYWSLLPVNAGPLITLQG